MSLRSVFRTCFLRLPSPLPPRLPWPKLVLSVVVDRWRGLKIRKLHDQAVRDLVVREERELPDATKAKQADLGAKHSAPTNGCLCSHQHTSDQFNSTASVDILPNAAAFACG